METATRTLPVAVGQPFSYEESEFFNVLSHHFERMPKAEPGEWLSQKSEVPQPFNCYRHFNFVSPTRNVIYIQPLSQCLHQSFLTKLKLFCAAFYLGMKVTIAPTIEFAALQERHRFTKRMFQGSEQFLTKDILNYLQGEVPEDAYAVMAVMDCDLYPYDQETFVFGWALYTKRVGIFSVLRWDSQAFMNGNRTLIDPQKILYPAIRTMLHEIGHMFGLSHCVFYRCHMSGFNSIRQNYKAPLEFCPVCFKKLVGNLCFEPAERYRALSLISQQFGFEQEAMMYKQLHHDSEKYMSKWWLKINQHLTHIKNGNKRSSSHQSHKSKSLQQQRQKSIQNNPIQHPNNPSKQKPKKQQQYKRLPPLPSRKQGKMPSVLLHQYGGGRYSRPCSSQSRRNMQIFRI